MQLSGGCHCGAITYKIAGEPLRMAQCHCNACRRTTGTGHLVQAFFKKADVAISGKPKTHQSTSDSGNVRTRHFCPTCGSRLFSENAKSPDTIGIAVGSFDNSEWFKPEVIVYTSQRPVWDPIDPEIPFREIM